MTAFLSPLIGTFAFGGWEILLILVCISISAFWVWMIVDCALYETSDGTRVIWLLVIIFGWMVGAPLYYVARKLPRYFVVKPAKTTNSDA